MTNEEKAAFILGWKEGIRYLGIDLDNYELRSYFKECKTLDERNACIQDRVYLAKDKHGIVMFSVF